MAPCNGTTTTPPKLIVILRTPTIAHYNGTLQWHHDHSTKISRHPPPPNHSTLQWGQTLALLGNMRLHHGGQDVQAQASRPLLGLRCDTEYVQRHLLGLIEE